MKHEPDRPEDELAGAFPGCRLTHVVRVTTTNEAASSLDVLRVLLEGEARLVVANLAAIGEHLEHRVIVSGISAVAARGRADALRGRAQVAHVSVEHHIAAAPAGGDRAA